MEADIQQTKMTLHLRDEAIRRLESLAYGPVSCDGHHVENNALNDENQLLQEKTDRNPELTRLRQENTNLFEQLRM